MSTPTTTRANLFSSLLILAIVAGAHAQAEWTVDFSRRAKETRSQDLREPASYDVPVQAGGLDEFGVPAAPAPQAPQKQSGGFFSELFDSTPISQEIVVMQTEKGFVPSTVRVKRGLSYQIHVVNVNEKEKNVSFVLDSFSEHHATYYGKIKTFVIKPQKEGVFKFVSPETSAQGKLVVFPDGPENRLPASVDPN